MWGNWFLGGLGNLSTSCLLGVPGLSLGQMLNLLLIRELHVQLNAAPPRSHQGTSLSPCRKLDHPRKCSPTQNTEMTTVGNEPSPGLRLSKAPTWASGTSSDFCSDPEVTVAWTPPVPPESTCGPGTWAQPCTFPAAEV